MEKQELLSAVSQMALSKNITKEELVQAYMTGAGQEVEHEETFKKRMDLSEVMYYIGGAIVFLGIAILCFQSWESFNSVVRIIVTLGSALAAYAVAVLLYKYEDYGKVSQAFFLISGMLAPLGLNVLFHEMGMNVEKNIYQLLIFFILSVWFLSSYFFFKRAIIMFFAIIFSTGFFHFIINIIVGDKLSYSAAEKLTEYRIMVLGLAYMLLGYQFLKTELKPLSGILYSFGSIFFLGSTMALGGWTPNQNVFWELVYPLLVFGTIFVSVYVKSKALLTFASLFLVGYILKITSEYFSNGLGWPLALVLAGLGIMAVGFYAVKLNKKYFKTV